MQFPRARFTLRQLMLVIALIAGLLAVPREWRWFTALIALPGLALFTASRRWVGGHRRLAAISFWGLGIPANVLFAALCAFPGMHSLLLFLLWLIVALPVVAGFGAAWASLATRDGAIRRRSRRIAWAWVFALAALPGLTAGTVWPFRLTFLATRAALERKADQVAAGRAISFPQWVGPFRLTASRVDPGTGGVALLTDPNPGGPCGFVRHQSSRTGLYRCFHPIRGDWWHLGLGSGWCYHEED